jgi:uncharacterized protein YciI
MDDPATRLFVIDLTYVVDLDQIDAQIPDHVRYLDRGYEDGVFVMSGRKHPRTGGVILAQDVSREAIIARAQQDPFIEMGLASMTVTEFHPNRSRVSF